VSGLCHRHEVAAGVRETGRRGVGDTKLDAIDGVGVPDLLDTGVGGDNALELPGENTGRLA
jgi:hypothetical protein